MTRTFSEGTKWLVFALGLMCTAVAITALVTSMHRAQMKAYLDSGCVKQMVVGSNVAQWVCPDE